MPRSSVSSAFRNILASEELQHLPDFLAELSRDVLLPLAGALLTLYVVLFIARYTYRVVVPPTAPELHYQALEALQSPKQVNEAVSLLWNAVTTDPLYEPAFMSLIAVYIYRLRQPHVAMKLLETLPSTNSQTTTASPEWQALRSDAEAMISGDSHMVQSVVGESNHLSITTAMRSYKPKSD